MSPADVLAHYLVFEGLARWPSVVNPVLWPVTVGLMPDEGVNALAVYETASVLQGRSMRTGTKVSKPGVQIRVRAKDHLTGYNRADDLAKILDAIIDAVVEVEAQTVTLHSVSRTSGVLPLGQEQGKPRFLFTINALLTIRGLSQPQL